MSAIAGVGGVGRTLRHDETLDRIISLVVLGRVRLAELTFEKDLCIALDLSRTPIREAMGILNHLGFVEVKPQVGFTIRRVGPTDLFRLTNLARQVEREALHDLMLSGQLAEHSPTLMRLSREAATEGRDYSHSGGQFILDGYLQSVIDLHSTICQLSGYRAAPSVIFAWGTALRLFLSEGVTSWGMIGLQSRADEGFVVDVLRAHTAETVQSVVDQYFAEQINRILPGAQLLAD